MLLSIFAILLGALLTPPAVRRFGHRAVSVAALLPAALALWALLRLPDISQGTPRLESIPWIPPLGLYLSFRMDGLSALFFLLVTGIGALIILYTAAYLRDHPQQGRFTSFTFLFMASMAGVVTADNLLLLFIFWELTSFSSYLLIGFQHQREAARNAALQALLVTGAGGLFLLAGLLLLGHAAGTYELSALLEGAAAGLPEHPLYPAILTLVFIGAFTKSAQWPFHFWLPNAMEAPSPASAYLHSSTMVKAGIYLLARLAPILGGTAAWTGWLTGIGGVTLLTAAVLALVQRPMKRLLAYSTVAALGLLTLCIGLGTSTSLAAMAAFLLAHALYKAALFLVAGIVDHETGERDVTKLFGLGPFMPLTFLAAAVAAFSMAGLPPLFGFVGKETLYAATRGQPILAVVVLAGNLAFVVVAVLTGWRIFRGPPSYTPKTPHEAPPAMVAGPLVLAALTLLTGLFTGRVGDLLVLPAAAATAGAPLEKHLVLWHGINRELLLSILTLGVGLLLLRQRPRLLSLSPRFAPLGSIGPGRTYHALLQGTLRFAGVQTRLLQSGYLRRYLRIIVLTTLGLCGWIALSHEIPFPQLELSPIHWPDAVVALLITAATLGAVHSPNRLGAIASLGVVGYAVALLYVFYGAPDLAMTQLVIETLTVILLVLAFYHLPSFSKRSPAPSRMRDVLICAAAGGLMSGLVLLAVSAGDTPSLADYYAANSASKAYGRNIVNVILVDFRALDTLGEITVLGIAAVGAGALLKLRSRRPGDAGKGGSA